jgi:hypothetical protein
MTGQRGVLTIRSNPPANSIWLPWLVGWAGGALLGVANGVTRRMLYEDRVGPLAAHYMATGTLIALFGLYFSALDRRWPIPTRRTAFGIGGSWLALTMLFEFGFGHYVAGEPWPKLLEQYDLSRGYVWVLALLWIAVGPATIHQRRSRQAWSVKGAI